MTTTQSTLSAILFDLDGTLLDTAPDLAHSFNQMRIACGQEPLPLDLIKQYAGTGSKELIKYSFQLQDPDERMPILLNRYYDFYEKNLANQTQLFEGISNVLDLIESRQIPWGIVTNKVSRFTHPLIQHFQLKAQCVICSDTLNILKPNPAPLLHACELLKIAPQNVLYVGDTQIDIDASKAANMPCAFASYGYTKNLIPNQNQQADFQLKKAMDLIPIIHRFFQCAPIS